LPIRGIINKNSVNAKAHHAAQPNTGAWHSLDPSFHPASARSVARRAFSIGSDTDLLVISDHLDPQPDESQGVLEGHHGSRADVCGPTGHQPTAV